MPQSVTEQEWRVRGHPDLRPGQRLGGVPVRGELVRSDLQVQLRRGAPGFRENRVGGTQQAFRLSAGQRHALYVELEILRAAGQDLTVQQRVAGVGRHPPLVEVIRSQRGQDTDHHQTHPGGVGGIVGGVEAGAQFAFKSQGFIVGQRPGWDVDLDVVLAEFGLESRIVDMRQHRLVSHRRIDIVVDEVELEFQAHRGGTRSEAVAGQHLRQRLQAPLGLVPVAL